MNSGIISASIFNKIPHIHDQPQLEPDLLEQFALLFQAHGVLDAHSLQLLHRHYQMPNDSIALTTQIDESIYVTKITPIHDVDIEAICGQLYLLNDEGNFQAYEYEYGPPVSFPPAFLSDLASLIRQNEIQDKVALVSASPKCFSFEKVVGSDATVTIFQPTNADADDKVIAWKFENTADEPPGSTIRVRGISTYQSSTCRHTDMYDQPFDLDKGNIRTRLEQDGVI